MDEDVLTVVGVLVCVVITVFAFWWKPTRREPPDETTRIGGPEVAALQAHLAKGNPMTLLAAIGAAREGQWSKRTFLCAELASKFPDSMFGAWLGSNPNQPLAQLLHGFRCVDAAWKARGHGKSDTVSRDAWNAVHSLAAQAKIAFVRAAEADPHDPTPWIGRIAAEMLIQPEDVKEQVSAHMEEALRRDPESHAAIARGLDVFAPYWFGEKDGEGLAKARSIAAGAPEGSVRPFGIIAAHHYEWHHKRHWGTETDAATYFTDRLVVSELRAAYSASIGSAAFRPPYNAISLYNRAAFCAYLAGQKDIVRFELARVGDRYTTLWAALPGVPNAKAGFRVVQAWAKS